MRVGLDWASNPLSYELETLTLVNNEGIGFDIRELMLECNIFESITSNFLVGEIAIADAVGFLENAKIFGQESLHIKFKQPAGGMKPASAPPRDKIDQIFRIYKVAGVHRIGQNTTVYKLYFCAPELIQAKRIRVSQALRGSMTKLALKMAHDHLGIERYPPPPYGGLRNVPYFDAVDHSAEENLQTVIPNWTVNFAINWLLQHAQGVDSKSGLLDSYFFFQTANGGYRIQNISGMIGVDYLGGNKFSYAPAQAARNKPEDWDQKPEPPNVVIGPGRKILSYNIGSSANVLEGTIEGLFAQKQITIDNINKVHIESYYDYHTSFDPAGSIESISPDSPVCPIAYPLVRREEEKIWIGDTAGPENEVINTAPYTVLEGGAVSSFPDAHTTLTSDSSFVNDKKNIYHHVNQNTHLGAVQTRTALRQLLKYYTMNILLPTRTDISVGKIINLEIPATRGLGNNEVKPALFHSGRYLITEIKWGLTPQGCRTNVKVIKDSLINEIETVPIEYPPTIKREATE